MITKTLTLDLNGEYLATGVTAKSGDKDSRQLTIQLTQDGQAYTVPSGVTAELRCTKPSGLVTRQPAAVSGSRVTVTLSEQALAEKGLVYADIVLIGSGGDRLSSASFHIRANPAAGEGAEGTSQSQIVVLENALAKARADVKSGMQAAVTEGTQQATTLINQARDAALADIPSDYTALSQEVEFKSPPIVSRAKGDSIHLDDAADSRLYADDGGAVVELYCKAKQVVTTGKNLLPYPYNESTKTANGVTFTVKPDGSIVANGTATVNATIDLYTLKSPHEFDGMILSGSPKGYDNSGINIKIEEKNSPWRRVATSYNGAERNINVQYDTTHIVQVQVDTGRTVNNAVFYPMIRQASVTNPTWEPYSGGVPSPSPEWPQEIVGTGNPVVDQHGKNLFDKSQVSASARTVTYSGLTLGEKYTAYTNIPKQSSGTTNIWFNGDSTDRNGAWDGNARTQTVNADGTLTLTVSTEYITKYRDNPSYWIMLSKGPVAQKYSPGGYQSTTIPLTGYGIPVSSGGNYTDDKGQQWVCDVVRLYKDGSGGIESRIKMLDSLDGVSFWFNPDRNIFYIYNQAALSDDNALSPIRCRALPVETANKQWISQESSVAVTKDGHISIKVAGSASANDYADFLHDNPIVFARLYTTTTPLTADQVAALKTLRTFKGVTDITCDQDVGMAVSYVNDPKLYIDKQIAALASRMGAAENVLTNNI